MSSTINHFSVEGRYLCVDLLNTEYPSKRGPVDRLSSADKIVDWLIELNVFSHPDDQAVLLEWVRQAPDQLVHQFHSLRDNLRRLVAALRAQQPLPPDELVQLQTLLASGCRTAQLTMAADNHWHVSSRLQLQNPLQLAVPLAESFAELLVADDAARLKECANPYCPMLFYDTTKNQSRTWCETCGSRAKALRYYHNKKAKS